VNGGAGSRVRLALCVSCAAIVATETARAGEAHTYAVSYSAPAVCPERPAFLEAIRTRATFASLVPSDADLAFDVRLVPEGELARGTLSVRFRAGERFAREVPAARCEDVTTSMAIMAGLLLSGALLPEPAPPEVTEPTPGSPVASATPSALLVPPPRSAAPPSGGAETPAKSESHTDARTPSRPLRFRAGAYADGRLDFGVAPFPAFGAVTGLDALVERDSWFSPSVRVGVVYVAGSASEAPLGGAHMSLRAISVRACPVRLPLGKPFTLDACGLFEGGVLTASPRSTPGATGDVDMSWLGFGGAGKLEAAVGPQTAFEAELSAFGLLEHDEFVVQPGDVNVYTVPALSGAFSLGLVVRWP
jgi:hypothetical protein